MRLLKLPPTTTSVAPPPPPLNCTPALPEKKSFWRKASLETHLTVSWRTMRNYKRARPASFLCCALTHSPTGFFFLSFLFFFKVTIPGFCFFFLGWKVVDFNDGIFKIVLGKNKSSVKSDTKATRISQNINDRTKSHFNWFYRYEYVSGGTQSFFLFFKWYNNVLNNMSNANNFKWVFWLLHMNVIVHESQIIGEKCSIFTPTVRFVFHCHGFSHIILHVMCFFSSPLWRTKSLIPNV